MGIEELKKLVVAIAQLLNCASKVVHNQGILMAIWDAVAPLKAISTINWDEFKKQLGDVVVAERKELEASFSNALDLVNKEVEAKIKAAVSALDEGIAHFEQVFAWLLKVKKLLGI